MGTNNSFDFGTMVDVKETEGGESVATTKFDFSTAEDIPTDVPSPERQSVISKFVRESIRYSPADMFKTSLFLAGHMPEVSPGEDFTSYTKKLGDVLGAREEEIIGQGIGKVLEAPIQASIVAGLIVDPVDTIIGVGAFSIKDKFINLRRMIEDKFPDTAPEILDIAEIADMALSAGMIGKGLFEGRRFMKTSMDALGFPRNVNINTEVVSNIKDSGNLLPNEKIDMMKTLGIEEKHIDASLSGNIPINVPVDKVMDLAEKPYWEMAKQELFGGAKAEPPLDLFGQPMEAVPPKVSQEVLGELKMLQKDKQISGATLKKLKDFAGIENIKRSSEPAIKKLIGFLEDLKPEDKFLSEKQVKDLGAVLKELPNPEVTPKRVILEKFGEKTAILDKGIMGKISPELVPSVDIKEGHPLVKLIVDKASEKMMRAKDVINERNKKLDKMVTLAERSRAKLLPLWEKVKRSITPQNKEIFQALSGDNIQLTREEVAVLAYLKNFFKKAKNDLTLDKYRRNYVTHIEKPLMEKILDKGLLPAIKDMLHTAKKDELPVDIMLELDNIIGSEKFFKFALERKGGVDPTTNIRAIINQYSTLLETKKALDQILPEGQAITRNLLQGKTAVWMKTFLQNLKGRGLDYHFKNGPMGWLAKTADAIVDLGYLKMLGLNWKSAVKNIVAGETNAWIFQDFKTYLEGKKRFISNPKKAYEMATRYGALEGTYADFAQKGIGGLKKAQDWMMVGQKVGEVEIRSSIFSGMLTEKEWKTGEIPQQKFNEIKDVIAKTQGNFSKWESPLLLQTWYGRMFFQMNRWRITNAMLLKGIVEGASSDIKAGKFNTQNVTRLGKTILAYGTGMYISYQLAQAGYKTASDVAKNMAQTVDGIFSLFTEGQLIKMFTDNPSLHTFKEISNTIQNTAKYLHIPGAKKAREKGIEDTYIAPAETTKDILESLND